MKTHHSTLLLLFLFLTPSLSATSHRCHPDDYKALIKIKNSFYEFNPNPFPSWVPGTDCCQWYGPECNETTNRVIELHIYSHPLSGQIPPEVADLPYLEYLTFRKLSNITGPVPRSITKLKKLRYLRLSWLNLTGPVPDFLSELTTLEFLELNFNHFTGPVPASFSKFTNLGALRLDRNRLTGSIPESFGHFTESVPDLYLSHNQLTGSIPKSFAKVDFVRIDLSRNKLVGDASMLFKPNGSADTIDISQNMFEFDFSKIRFSKRSLISLDMNHNKIYGNIPQDIVDIDYLQILNVSYNRLCGEIPTGGRMDRFDESSYIHNRCLCGRPLTTLCK